MKRTALQFIRTPVPVGNYYYLDLTDVQIDALSYPVPGSEYCIALLGAQHQVATLRMYNMLGEVISSLEIWQHHAKIELPGLVKGIYPYTFEREGRIIGSGKWIRE